jgi:hypothetical protein
VRLKKDARIRLVEAKSAPWWKKIIPFSF